MKLQLKHLSPYLPYELNVISCHHNIDSYEIVKGLNKDKFITNVDTFEFKHGKPILRPLSDLNKKKQIAEYFCSFYDHVERINPSTYETQNCALMLDGTIEMQYYNDYQFLFAWHFDVFGLIEKGLAIDINTLK